MLPNAQKSAPGRGALAAPPRPTPERTIATESMASIELKNVIKRYGKGKAELQVIHGVNATIRDGEFVVIVGYSGSGKSTLINLISGLVKPDTGEAAVNLARRRFAARQGQRAGGQELPAFHGIGLRPRPADPACRGAGGQTRTGVGSWKAAADINASPDPIRPHSCAPAPGSIAGSPRPAPAPCPAESRTAAAGFAGS